MALPRFKTNRRLWVIFSTILFLVPWFIPMNGKMEDGPLLRYPLGIFTQTRPAETLGVADCVLVTFQGILLFGIPALLIGWVLQCFVVMFTQKKEKLDHAA